MDLEFLLPGAKHQLRLPARVTRMELPDRIALGYIDLSPDNKAALWGLYCRAYKDVRRCSRGDTRVGWWPGKVQVVRQAGLASESTRGD